MGCDQAPSHRSIQVTTQTTQEFAEQLKVDRANGIRATGWHNGRLVSKFWTGEIIIQDPALYTTEVREQYFRFGIESKAGNTCAVEAKDFPDRAARSREAFRRLKVMDDWHSQGGGWEMPRASRETGPDSATLAEIIDRVHPGEGQTRFNNALRKFGGDLAKARELILGKTDYATSWARIKFEREQARIAARGQTVDVGNPDDDFGPI